MAPLKIRKFLALQYIVFLSLIFRACGFQRIQGTCSSNVLHLMLLGVYMYFVTVGHAQSATLTKSFAIKMKYG